MSRISRHMMWMQMAKSAAMRSTCYRLNVGAIIVKNHQVVSVGYNGARSGAPHCTGNGCSYFVADKGCSVVHAEANAIMSAQQKNRYDLIDALLYCTHSPCNGCVDLLLGKGTLNNQHGFAYGASLGAIYYETEYRDRSPIDRLISETKIGLFRIQPSGYLIDLRTGELCEPDYEIA